MEEPGRLQSMGSLESDIPLLPENYAFLPVAIDLQHPTLCMGFPGGSAGKESACNTGDLGLIPELG